jgi:myo-inositol-1(or 4)-monophosphatase
MRAQDLNRRLSAATSIAREAGSLARGYLADPDRLDVSLKGPQDFVTAADRAAERLIVTRLQAEFPQDSFLGEEGQGHGAVDATALWVIDPIDGTANFVRDRPEWAVSIGFVAEGQPQLGVIYHAATDSLYATAAGAGATRNGVRIAASSARTFDGATVALETDLRKSNGHYLRAIEALGRRGGEYRRYGSAALCLALVADGRIDGFIEAHLNAWDVTAGIVLVREAGGWTNDFFADDGLRRGNRMIAAAAGLRDDILAIWSLAHDGSAG